MHCSSFVQVDSRFSTLLLQKSCCNSLFLISDYTYSYHIGTNLIFVNSEFVYFHSACIRRATSFAQFFKLSQKKSSFRITFVFVEVIVGDGDDGVGCSGSEIDCVVFDEMNARAFACELNSIITF